MALSDEHQSLSYAALNERAGCVLLTGIESDILVDGALDLPDEALAGVEVVIASVQRSLST